MVLNFTFGLGFILFSQINFDRVVAVFLLSVVNDWMCPVYLVLKSPSVLPIYFLVILLGDVVVASYITLLLDLHLPSKGQLRFLQLQSCSSSAFWGLMMLLLWLCIIAPIFPMQLYPIFRVFLLKIFARGFLLLFQPIIQIYLRGLDTTFRSVTL